MDGHGNYQIGMKMNLGSSSREKLFWKSVFDAFIQGVFNSSGDGDGVLAITKGGEFTLEEVVDAFMEHQIPLWNFDGTIKEYKTIKDSRYDRRDVEIDGKKQIHVGRGEEWFMFMYHEEGMTKGKFADIFIAI